MPLADIKIQLNEVKALPSSANLSHREVDEIIQSTVKIVGDTNIDWLKRLNMLKNLRSLCCDQAHHAQILENLRRLVPPLQLAVKDLRSQVGREACLTVAYITYQFGIKCDSFVEPLLSTLFSLLIAQAKIVSMTGSETISLLYEYVQSWRILPQLQIQMNSKSKEVRRAVSYVLKIIFENWSSPIIAKQLPVICEVMKKALTDADAEVRQTARETFPLFQRLFPTNAKTIIDSLEPQQQRQILAVAASNNVQSSSIQSTGCNSRPATSSSSAHNIKQSFPSSNHAPPHVSTNSTGSLSRQGSLVKKSSIPVSTRMSPSPLKNDIGSTRSASAIDLQAVKKARQNNFSTLNNRQPLSNYGRTHSSLSSANTKYTLPNSSNVSPTYGPPSSMSMGAGTLDRTSRNRAKTPKYSHSQPGSRSNSPASRYAYATYTSPYSQHVLNNSSGNGSITSNTEPLSLFSTTGGRRKISTPNSSGDSPSLIPTSLSIGRSAGRRRNSSNSSSRETSPQGQGRVMNSKLRSRSISNSPQVPLSLVSANSSTAKLLMASREAEADSALRDGTRRKELSEVDYGNLSDSEDSMSSHSHRSYRSENFSPPTSTRHLFPEDNVEDLLNKCGSAKWSERKEGLCGLNNYLQRYGGIPPQYLIRIGQTFCRIFMDAHTKVLSLFLDVLHAVLLRHARDLVDFTTVLLNRVLTKMGSDLLNSVHTKLLVTLDIIMKEMPPDLQFSAVAHYLCDPTQTPNSRSRIAALLHLFNLSSVTFPVKQNELQALVDKLLDWSVDVRSQELRRTSQEVLRSLFDMTAPQVTRALSNLPPDKQDQARTILESNRSQQEILSSPQNNSSNTSAGEDIVDVSGWHSIASEIQSLRITENYESDILRLLTQFAVVDPAERNGMICKLHTAIKESKDEVLVQCHKELLKILFNALTSTKAKSAEKTVCFSCLEDLCSREGLRDCLAEYTELFIVRVTEVQSTDSPREVTKAAEGCALTLAANFPPEIVARAVCPIVLNKDFPVNQLAIKMLQRLSETCETVKLRSLLPDIMNALVCAYDHPDSAVRKSSVFAIVALHVKLTSELDTYLSGLSGSKLKLLQLYIQRAQNSNNQ